MAEAICQKLAVHGRWHHGYELKRNGTTIKSLDCDPTDQAVALMDLDTLKVGDWDLPESVRDDIEGRRADYGFQERQYAAKARCQRILERLAE